MRSHTLFTIGYEGSSIGDFRATLEAARINLVIDVRDVPISRKPGFSKTALAAWFAAADIALRAKQFLHRDCPEVHVALKKALALLGGFSDVPAQSAFVV
jgi:hypothetical protein